MLITACAWAGTIEIHDQAVNRASLSVATISRDAGLTINTFDISQVDLRNAKHRDTAERAAASVPQLLAVDITESLRDAGFSSVVLAGRGEAKSISELNLHGRFTKIDPGSQAAQAWLGVGAGESKVCVDGVISDHSGTQLGYFSHCSKGLGWGESDARQDQDATRIGQSIATFLFEWSQGKFADQQ